MSLPEDLVTEEPVTYGEDTYIARRSTGEPVRWQVFRDGQLTPAGFLEAVFDVDLGQWQLKVSDGNGTPIGDEPVSTYHNCLSHLRMNRWEKVIADAAAEQVNRT